MTSRLVLAIAGLCMPALAQESFWIASRASSDLWQINAWGSVVQRVTAPANLSKCVTAPDGKVWIVRFIQATFDIYDPATSTMTPVTSPSGSVSNIAFDAAGNAWVTVNSTLVHEFDAAGTFLQTFTLPVGNGQGITIDALDNKWIAHRIGPASISRIDSTGVVTNFPIVGAGAMLPIGPVADYRGLAQPSHIWVTGDSANVLAEIDGATGATLNVYPMPITSIAYPPTFDAAGRIWVSSFGNATVLQVDQANGTVLQTFTYGPNNIGITTDSHGRILTTSRVTFSGVGPPCEVRRLDPITGALEMPTLLTLGGINASGTYTQVSTPWQYSLVVAPFGDMDGDGETNWGEIQAGSSPIDPTSSSAFCVESFGVTQNGSTPSFNVTAPGSLWIVGFATALIPPTPVPGFGGALRLDPTTLLTTVAAFGSGNIPLPLPANPGLIGIELFTQGVLFNGVGFDFRNVSGLVVW